MAEIKCNTCNRNFGSEESLKQHSQASHLNVKEEKNIRKYVLFSVLFVSLLLFSYTVYVKAQKPGEYDEFAKCLTEKEVVVYGNDFCSYTTKQLNFFGKSKEYLNYVKCIDNEELCDSKNIQTTPTWEINGTMHEEVQDFEKLSKISGCVL